MSNVIYTSYGWGTGEGGHGHFDGREWTEVQREKISEYCRINSIDLKVIDTEHKWMSKILSTIEPDKDIHSKNHSVYTLSAIAALLDFCESDHDLFYWLHLDMAIGNMDVNVFDTFYLPDDRLYVWAKEDFYLDRDWDRTKLGMLDNLERATGSKISPEYKRFKVNASNVIASKSCAKKFREVLLNQVNFLENPPNPAIGFIEETVIEAVEAASDIEVGDFYTFNDKCVYDKSLIPVNFCEWDGYNSSFPYNSVFVHFWGERKFSIPQFYRDRNML